MIDKAIEMVKELRREYSGILYNNIDGSLESEDLIRLVGHLQATYDHLLATKAQGGDLYCVLGKHLPVCLVLAGEIGSDVSRIYSIMSILTDGKIKPCSSCEEDRISK